MIKTLQDVKDTLKTFDDLQEAFEYFKRAKVPSEVSEQFYNEYAVIDDDLVLGPVEAFDRLYMEVHGGIKC